MQHVDKQRLVIFANTYLSSNLASKLKQDVNTLESRHMDIHVEDMNTIFQAEDMMADPGSEMLRVVKNAIDSLPPLQN